MIRTQYGSASQRDGVLVTRDSLCRRVRAGQRYYCDASIGDRGRHLVVRTPRVVGVTERRRRTPGTVVKMLNAAGALRVTCRAHAGCEIPQCSTV